MALNSGPNVERFVSLPKPHVWLYGSASDARGLPLASVSRVQMRFNGIDHEVIIIGQTPRSAIFGDGRSIGTKRHRVQLFPTQRWGISFQFPDPVDWKTPFMETAIAEEASSPSVNSTTSVDVNEAVSEGEEVVKQSKSYANAAKTLIEPLNNKLNFVPTAVIELGNEVVIFDEELVEIRNWHDRADWHDRAVWLEPEQFSSELNNISLCSKLVGSRYKEVNMAARDSDGALVCCVKNTVKDRIMDSDASFHATYCKEELERFKLRSDIRYIPGLKRRLISVGQLNEEDYYVGFKDQQWKVTKGSLVHQRLGDMSRIGMNMLASKGNVPDVQKVDIYFCKPGGLGKQKKLSFLMSEKTRKLQRLKQVYTEGYGPTFISSSYYDNIIENCNRICGRYNENLQFGVAERLSQTFRAESMGPRLRIPEEEWRGKDTSSGLDEMQYSFRILRVTRRVKWCYLDISENLIENDSIVAENGLSSEIIQSLSESSDTSEGSKNSGSFEDSGRSDEEYSEDGASFKEGGFEILQVRRSTRESRAPVRVFIFVEDSWNEEPCSDVHQVGDKREFEVLRSFNWPLSQLITNDAVLPERGYSQFNDVARPQVNLDSTIAQCKKRKRTTEKVSEALKTNMYDNRKGGRKHGYIQNNNWQVRKQWYKEIVNVGSGNNKEKYFKEEFPSPPLRNDKGKNVVITPGKGRQENKYSVLADMESDDLDENKMLKDRMINNPLVILGDFNVTLKIKEHSFWSFVISNDMHDFIDCANTLEVEYVNVSDIQMVKVVRRLKYLKTSLKNLSWKKGDVSDRVKNSCFKRIKLSGYVKGTEIALVSTKDDVAMQFVNHYKEFFGQAIHVDVISCMDEIFTKKLSSEDALMMVREVNNEEVKPAIFDISENKGLDDYTSSFPKKHGK
nr:retrovirus-related Pol polyprotein from transposon TNT 1-94 [Tanacetum cinerariifolium]